MRRALPLLVMLTAACDSCDEVCDSSAAPISVGGIWTIEGEGERAGCRESRYSGSFELGPSVKLAIVVQQHPRPDASVARDGVAVPADGGLDVSLSQDLIADLLAGDAADAPVTDSASLDLGDLGVDRAADLFGVPDVNVDLASGDAPPAAVDLAQDADAQDAGAQEAGAAQDAGSLDRRWRPDLTPPEGWNEQLFSVAGAPTGFSLSGRAQGSCVSFDVVEEDLQAGTLFYRFSGTIEESGSRRSISGSFTGSGPAGCKVAGDFEVTIR